MAAEQPSLLDSSVLCTNGTRFLLLRLQGDLCTCQGLCTYINSRIVQLSIRWLLVHVCHYFRTHCIAASRHQSDAVSSPSWHPSSLLHVSALQRASAEPLLEPCVRPHPIAHRAVIVVDQLHHRVPHRVWILRRHIRHEQIRAARDWVPRVVRDLHVQLAGAPAAVLEVEAQRCRRSRCQR